MKKRIIILIVILAIIVGGVFVYFKLMYKNGDLEYGGFTVLKGHYGKVEKYDASHTVEGYKGSADKAYYIIGKVTSKNDVGFTVITFDLYNKKDKKLGVAVAGLSKLEKGKEYNFRALSLVEGKYTNEIDHYKLNSIK